MKGQSVSQIDYCIVVFSMIVCVVTCSIGAMENYNSHYVS